MKRLVAGVGTFVNHPIQGITKGVKRGPLPNYSRWQTMLSRCYNVRNVSYPIYGGKGVTVATEWHDFQTFAIWYEENFVEGWDMDKDLLGGKQYGPKTVVWLPKLLHYTLTHRAKQKWKKSGKKTDKKYMVVVQDNGVKYYHGTFDTKEEAIAVYDRVYDAKVRRLVTEYPLAPKIIEAILSTLS